MALSQSSALEDIRVQISTVPGVVPSPEWLAIGRPAPVPTSGLLWFCAFWSTPFWKGLMCLAAEPYLPGPLSIWGGHIGASLPSSRALSSGQRWGL